MFQHAFSKSAICDFLKIKYHHVQKGQCNEAQFGVVYKR